VPGRPQEPALRRAVCPHRLNDEEEIPMGKGKMNGDNSAASKADHAGHKTRGSGGTMKNPNDPSKQDNNKAQNTNSNSQ
jgi:hypothetical protein